MHPRLLGLSLSVRSRIRTDVHLALKQIDGYHLPVKIQMHHEIAAEPTVTIAATTMTGGSEMIEAVLAAGDHPAPVVDTLMLETTEIKRVRTVTAHPSMELRSGSVYHATLTPRP